jgi:hypothetical protein
VPEVQPAASTRALEIASAAELNLGEIIFDSRDEQLLQQLQKSAYANRRTLAAEILYHLDRAFDTAA